MRKLICYGLTGLAVVVGSYKGWQSAGSLRRATAESSAAGQTGISSDRTSSPADRHADGECCLFRSVVGSCQSEKTEAPACAEDAGTKALPVALNHAIDLPSASAGGPAAIYIPESNEPPAPLPEGEAQPGLEQRAAVPARVMPDCEDEEVVPTMAPAADDPWPSESSDTGSSAGWFQEAKLGEPSVPDCREDDNLFRQYPGCPFPGDKAPSGKQESKRGAEWQHDKAPILPNTPEFDSFFFLPEDSSTGGAGFAEPKETNASAKASQPTHHRAFKFRISGASDKPAQQKVDTLEMRPTDLDHDDVWRDWF